MLKLGVKDIDGILISHQKMIPNNQQNINRKIKLYQNLDTIQKPKLMRLIKTKY
tara:strand:- start:5214 stop:5375 length:162 start_codon:yes stop_codon:yes gene_type:complete